MLVSRLGEHHYVVDEDSHVVKAAEEQRHDTLKVGRQRLQTERRASELVLRALPGECRLVAILYRNGEAVVRLPQVQGGEHLGSGEGLEDVADERERRRVVGNEPVERTEVMADTEIRFGARGVLLRNQEERRVERGRSGNRLNDFVSQPCLELGLDRVVLRLRQRVLAPEGNLARVRGNTDFGLWN